MTLTRLYVLVHPYQTLVREIATPTIPAFATATLQLLKSARSSSALPFTILETVVASLLTLVPLYSTTFRPFSSQIRTALKPYIAPTSSDTSLPVPETLRKTAGSLLATLHHVAAKAGGSEEWTKLINDTLKDLHATADQIFRAVDESWEGTNGFSRVTGIALGGSPNGGGTSPEDLPPWSGLQSGAERLTGLVQILAQCMISTTKSAVTVPTGALMDTIARLCSIARISPKTQSWDEALQTKAAIGRDEKDELWGLMPEIHSSALQLLLAMFTRLDQNMTPLIPEALDHLTRVFSSGIDTPCLRQSGYQVLEKTLTAAGLTLEKASVNMLEPLIRACCRDLQEEIGFLKPDDKIKPAAADAKKNGSVVNADLFLQSATTASAGTSRPTLTPQHKDAAFSLLGLFMSSLPQVHLKAGLRAIIEQTAIVTRNKDAMIASVLNPYKDPHGKAYASILPQLTQQFPDDPILDVLRTNLRTDGVRTAEDLLDAIDEEEELSENEEAEKTQDTGVADTVMSDADPQIGGAVAAPSAAPIAAAPQVQLDLPVQRNPFEPNTAESIAVYGNTARDVASPPKRKNSSPDIVPAKRQEVGEQGQAKTVPAPVDEEDDSDDESVHLNMEFDDDGDGEDE